MKKLRPVDAKALSTLVVSLLEGMVAVEPDVGFIDSGVGAVAGVSAMKIAGWKS